MNLKLNILSECSNVRRDLRSRIWFFLESCHVQCDFVHSLDNSICEGALHKQQNTRQHVSRKITNREELKLLFHVISHWSYMTRQPREWWIGTYSLDGKHNKAIWWLTTERSRISASLHSIMSRTISQARELFSAFPRVQWGKIRKIVAPELILIEPRKNTNNECWHAWGGEKQSISYCWW